MFRNKSGLGKKAVLYLAILFLAFIQACTWGSSHMNVKVPPEIPAQGLYIGALLLAGQTTIDGFNNDMGVRHAIFGEFFQFPEILNVQGEEYARISAFIESCRSAGAIPMLTLEAFGGLESYTADQIEEMADMLYNFDISLILRWNHEMNGSWYPWGQQPELYIQKFREFAVVIHESAPNVAMAWTPNQGWGYPWPGGEYYNPAFTEGDDPYAPYYPGNDYVDWVGHSFYHWSNGAELGINEVPYDGQWGQANGIDNAVPNFHDIYAAANDKPMIIAETSAFYDPADTKGGGASEQDIKNKWILEVYNLSAPDNPTLTGSFPMIKAILWFSQLKYEQEVGGEVDWRLNSNQEVIDYYSNIVSDPYFIKAP